MLILSECRQASERQELAFTCTQSAGVFSALTLAWNLGYQCSPRVKTSNPPMSALPSHVGEVRVGNDGFRCFDRVLGCPVGSGSSGEGLCEQTRLVADELGSVGFDDTGQSGYLRNVVNLKQTMDAPSGYHMRTFGGSACDEALLERRRRNWMTSRGPSLSISWIGE